MLAGCYAGLVEASVLGTAAVVSVARSLAGGGFCFEWVARCGFGFGTEAEGASAAVLRVCTGQGFGVQQGSSDWRGRSLVAAWVAVVGLGGWVCWEREAQSCTGDLV